MSVRPAINPIRAACLRTALAVGSVALLPALGWQAGDVNSPAIAAPVQMSPVAETVIGKHTATWTHKKADRGVTGAVVQLVSVDAEALPGEGDGEATALIELEPARAVDHSADRQAYADWLSVDDATGNVRITGFDTRHEAEGRRSCRQTHDTIVSSFGIDPDRAKVLADQPVMFQSSICAANGEIIITCHGSNGTISPRRLRPNGRCSRG